MKRLLKGVVLGLLVLCSTVARAELRLPALFSSGAVLQQGTDVPVWGWADAGAEVRVTFAGQTKTATADADGRWLVRLEALPASREPDVLRVAAGESDIAVENVLVGEVWFCSGQSNMEWPIARSLLPEHIDPDAHPTIRHIKVPRLRAGQPADDFQGSWQVCTAATAPGFTAVGFFFAYSLQKELDVPVGLINCSWGGTRIEPWTPPAGFDLVEELDAAELADRSTMYHGMVAAVQPYAVRGALWYQGESNGAEGESYFWKMKALVGGWRATWQQGEFPFYFVQLANFRAPNPDPAGGDGWARLREAQLRAACEVPRTGMAVIIDIGEADDIHPQNKFDVGRRLALWALAHDDGREDLVYSGPLMKDATVEGDRIRIAFDHVGGGLMAARKAGPRDIAPPKLAEKLRGFAIAGADRQWHWADAVIDGNAVLVSAAAVPEPVAVRYAFSMNPAEANLYNREGLPASPFRTDDW